MTAHGEIPWPPSAMARAPRQQASDSRQETLVSQSPQGSASSRPGTSSRSRSHVSRSRFARGFPSHVRGRRGGAWSQPVRRTTTAFPAHPAPRRPRSNPVTNAQAAVPRRAEAAAVVAALRGDVEGTADGCEAAVFTAAARAPVGTGCVRHRWPQPRGGRGSLRPHACRAGGRRRYSVIRRAGPRAGKARLCSQQPTQ